MARAAQDYPVVTVRSRSDLRDWLSVHHATASGHWLVTYKRAHPDYLAYEAVVEELLCWGWIDSVPRALDGDRSMVLITPRKITSAWSAVNKAHVERARASQAMTPAGEAKIAAAIANGMWDFLHDVDALRVPDDLSLALTEVGAQPGWDAYPPSVRRGTLEWVKTARTPSTRAARVADVAQSVGLGQRPKPFRQGRP